VKRGEVARSISRGAFFLALEKSAAIASTLLYSALMARWLGPTKYGILTVAFSIVSLATAFTGNFEMYLERFAAEYQVHDRPRTLRRAYHVALALKLGLGLLASAALVLAARWLASFYSMPELTVLLPLLVVFVATDGLATTGRSLLFGLQHFGWVSGLSLIFNVGKTLLVAFLWNRGQGLRALAIGFSVLTLVQAVVICGASLWLLARRPRERPETGPEPAVEGGLVRSMIAYCAPLYGARLSFLSGQNLGKLVLGRVLDATQLGYFSFAFQTVERFVELVHTLPNALLPSLTTIVARQESERLRWVMEQAFRLVQLVACLLSLVLFLYAREIVRVVGSPLFLPAVPLLRVLALVPLARTAQQPLTMMFQALRRPGHVFGLALLKMLTEVGGYFVLLLPLGAIGACWANLAGACVSFVGALVLAAGVLPEGAGERTSATVRAVLLAMAGMGLALLADRELGLAAALVARVLLVPPLLGAVFATRLVTRYDLEKLSTLPLPGPWLPGARDRVVTFADGIARVFERRRTA
jgi:PST family polysaccharide transporter